MSIKKILTRRDFLSNGMVHSFGSIFLPSLATLLRNERALAAGEACSINGEQMPAFIAIDLQGGGSIAGNNVMVYDDSGKLLTDYKGLGLAAAVTEANVNTTFGLPMHASSPMLRGMMEMTTAEIRSKVDGFVICSRSTDDTRSNRMATAPGIFKAGCNGSLVPLVGMRRDAAGGSGGNSMTPFVTDVAPTIIENIASAEQLLSAGELWSGQRAQRLEKVLKATEKLSSTRLEALGKLSLEEQFAQIVACNHAEAQKMLTGGDKPNLKPDVDPALKSVSPTPPLNPCTPATSWAPRNPNAEAVRQVGYMVLKGYAGSGTITLPCYDYHNSKVLEGFNADIRAGHVIGEMLSMAHALQRKLMLHIYTDGGVDSAEGEADNGKTDEDENSKKSSSTIPAADRKAWTGDSEMRAAAFVLVYDPTSKPTLTNRQMGAYQSAHGGTINLQPSKCRAISDSPEAHAIAVVANYLAWQGREAELFTKVTNNKLISEKDLQDYLFIAKQS